MLVAQPDAGVADRFVRDLPEYLSAGDVLVLNDSRVIPARLPGLRQRGELRCKMEVSLLKPLSGGRWRVLARPLRRLRPGDTLRFGDVLLATVREAGGGTATLEFNRTGAAFQEALKAVGETPLPPYITRRRPADAADRESYQTVYAAAPGAVAAPTAGLHFDPPLLEALAQKGVRLVRVTLHVGGGTFLPIRAGAAIAAPESEWGILSREAADEILAARARNRRVITVGTTSLRLVETAAMAGRAFGSWEGETSLFIRPGHRFRIAQGLITNFHLPHSSLFVLVCAYLGIERCRRLYRHALETGYRFYSYGDTSLLFR